MHGNNEKRKTNSFHSGKWKSDMKRKRNEEKEWFCNWHRMLMPWIICILYSNWRNKLPSVHNIKFWPYNGIRHTACGIRLLIRVNTKVSKQIFVELHLNSLWKWTNGQISIFHCFVYDVCSSRQKQFSLVQAPPIFTKIFSTDFDMCHLNSQSTMIKLELRLIWKNRYE